MRKLKFIALTIFLFIISAILLLQIDDNLDPQTQSMYEQATAHKESEAYLYLLGIKAAADENPETVGNALMASIRKAEKTFFKDPLTQKFEYQGYPDDKSLPLPQLDMCNGEDNCEYIDQLFSYQFDLEGLPEEQAVLLKRYKKFINMDDFHTLSLPHLEAITPPFEYIMKGNSLASLEAIAIAKSGNIKKAKKLLRDDLSALRSQLQQADTFLGKLIYASAMSKTLDVLSVLIHKYNSPAKDTIQALSINERSLVKAMNFEYAMGQNMMKSWDRAPNLLSTTDNSQQGNLPGWVSKILFKSNMTLNSFSLTFRQVGQDSLLTSKVFSRKVSNNKPVIKKTSYIRNYAGTVLSQINGPDYNIYIARIFSLDAKIHLFNKTANQTKLPATLSHISNPFYNDKVAYYSENKKAICVDAPLLKELKDYRCLRIR